MRINQCNKNWRVYYSSSWAARAFASSALLMAASTSSGPRLRITGGISPCFFSAVIIGRMDTSGSDSGSVLVAVLVSVVMSGGQWLVHESSHLSQKTYPRPHS